ncbi:heterokaryon incompatibility protein [Seiridium cupressi]
MEHYHRFSAPGALGALENIIPRTVRDAIARVKALGERYQWADALCLISDLDDDLRDGIQAIYVIYESSTLNTIVASGFDAGSSLPEVRFGYRRSEQLAEFVRPAVLIAARQNGLKYLKASCHHTRGWDFAGTTTV